MKWRVERPELQFVNLPPESVDPDIVEADLLRMRDGCLAFLNDAKGPRYGYVRIYAPGRWTAVERVEDEK